MMMASKKLVIILVATHVYLFDSKLITRVRTFLTNTNTVQNSPIVHEPIKLPVWPVAGGCIAQILDWCQQTTLTEGFLDRVGGRVVPITMSDMHVSPFLLLAHHTHSFMPLDPFREVTKFILPEGFPAHPHSGFSTVTYCLEGGLQHRDSEGLKMSYGNGDVQWMRAGRGTIHEEMWNIPPNNFEKIEIFQLWVNLPASKKTLPPQVTLLRETNIPTHAFANGNKIKVICGTIHTDDATIDGPGNDATETPVGIFHVTLQPNSCFSFEVPKSTAAAAYVRRGTLKLENSQRVRKDQMVAVRDDEVTMSGLVVFNTDESSEPILTGSNSNPTITINLTAGHNGLDALVLMGEPLGEPVLWRGPLVQADQNSFVQSAECFNAIGGGGYWDYRMPDSEWQQQCRKLGLQDLIKTMRTDLPEE